MNLANFKRFEEINRQKWRILASADNIDAIDAVLEIMNVFKYNCPACHIALRAFYMNEHTGTHFCINCPITKWREREFKEIAEGSTRIYCTCCIPGESFINWFKAESVDKGQVFAKEIADMEWSYIPEYDTILNDQEEIDNLFHMIEVAKRKIVCRNRVISLIDTNKF